MSAQVTRLIVETIPHGKQRYDTIGDWLYDESTGTVTVYTSDLGDWRMSMACAIHELVETMLCVRDGVSEAIVSRFDVLYEERRQECLAESFLHGQADWRNTMLYAQFGCDCTPTVDSEPGEDPHAPYRRQHAFADGIERLLANQLGVVWDEYAGKVTELDYEAERAKTAADL